ncbi:MAG TPA: phosphoribosylformylglycinamidine synthase, partial [Verrucomicrobia bacterium]|nr:phosphoribosylformylglycinamidine synthase [Verrucomicrobiota bacterium]
MISLHHVCCTWNPELPDSRCASIRRQAERHLGLRLKGLKHVSVYAVRAALDAAQLARLAREGLSDAVAQRVGLDRLPDGCGGFASFILVGKLPGTTDDEGLSAQRTLHDLLGVPFAPAPQEIFSSDLYLLEDALDDATLLRLGTELLGNPLVNRFTCGSTPSLVLPVPEAEPEGEPTVETVSLEVSDEALEALSKQRLLSLDRAEMKAIQAYFRDPNVQARRAEVGLPVAPTDGELEILAQTWSEHCKHKEFNALIRYVDKETGREETIDSLFKTYIRASTEEIARRLEAAGNNWLVKVFSDNAGVVRVDRDRLFVFKVETHNSPSALDPFGGAITGILGNNRDPLGTGRGGAALLFNTDVLCFGSPSYTEPLLPGQLHPRRVFAGVRQGIEEGGNKSGIPTINGAIVFDPRYAGKPLVYCGTAALMPAEIHGQPGHVKLAKVGDRIMMIGGRIGKDGIHGATFSSEELHEGSPATAVQIGDPITQKRMFDFLIRARDKGLYRFITDNGAGGLSSSIGEMSGECNGCRMDLAKAPLKYPGLDPWEILISEAQERMSLAVPPEKLDEFMAMATRFGCEATVLGEFTDSGIFHIQYGDKTVAWLPMAFMHEGLPPMQIPAKWQPPVNPEAPAQDKDDWTLDLLELMGRLNICSKESVVRRYDHEVQGGSVVKPFSGVTNVGPSDAAVVRPILDSFKGVVVSHGICPRYSDIDAYHMAANAIDEALRNYVAVGGNPEHWAGLDNFCWCDPVLSDKTPDGPYKMAQLVRANQALLDYCVPLNLPLISGKDSMKNDFYDGTTKISIPPTLLFSVIGTIPDARCAVTMDFKRPGDIICLLGDTKDELGGSEYLAMQGYTGSKVPQVDVSSALARYKALHQAIMSGLVASCHDL